MWSANYGPLLHLTPKQARRCHTPSTGEQNQIWRGTVTLRGIQWVKGQSWGPTQSCLSPTHCTREREAGTDQPGPHRTLVAPAAPVPPPHPSPPNWPRFFLPPSKLRQGLPPQPLPVCPAGSALLQRPSSEITSSVKRPRFPGGPAMAALLHHQSPGHTM